MKTKIVTHLAIKHKPPCLKFQYMKSSSSKSHHKRIKINLSNTMNCSAATYVAILAEKHPELSQVPAQTLIDLIDRLSSYRQTSLGTENVSTDDNLLSNIFYSPTKNVSKKLASRYDDLNHASEEELTHAKKEMNVLFAHAAITPGDARYEYDKRIEFDADEESSWD